MCGRLGCSRGRGKGAECGRRQLRGIAEESWAISSRDWKDASAPTKTAKLGGERLSNQLERKAAGGER